MWSDQDRIDALVWQTIDDDRCPKCGQPRHESMHPANQWAYEVHRLVCHACKAVDDDIDKLSDPKSVRFMYFVPELEVNDGA